MRHHDCEQTIKMTKSCFFFFCTFVPGIILGHEEKKREEINATKEQQYHDCIRRLLILEAREND